MTAYQHSLNAYRDIKNSIDTAEEKGHKRGKLEGRLEEKIESVTKGIIAGVPIEIISKMTGLSVKEIKKLKEQLSIEK